MKDPRSVLIESGPDALRQSLDAAELIAPEPEPAPPARPVVDLTRFDLSDAGNAERFHAMHGSNVRHVAESEQWLLWTGTRWQPDTDGAITRAFVDTMRAFAKQAADIREPQTAQAVAKFALRSTNRGEVNAALAMAQSIQGMTVAVADLDADPWLVGTPNGVIDLRTGEAITPERGQLITKSIGAAYDPAATCPRWEAFIADVTGGDTELAAYLQAAVGYTLTGTTREQCLFFLHGGGQNGKGVFSETAKRLIGDYGQTAPETLFTRDRNSSATNDVARLAGCRLAIAAELDEGAAFAESRIKALTGGDTITARFLHREFFDFPPTHKFWISGNHKPTVRGTDTGIWRRLRLVPFTVRIPDERKDPALAEKLVSELPGILNWALAGCLRWQRHGLEAPECVRRATESYRAEEDIIGQFLTDCTTADETERVLQSSLFESYQAWAEKQGIRHPLTATKFNRKLDERGFRRSKIRGGFYWHGITIDG